MATIKSYPLQWPVGWKRIKSDDRKEGNFKQGRDRISVSAATRRILHELELMDISGDDLVISTNIELRLDGLPRNDRSVVDPGVCIYWKDGEQSRCMAVDAYTKVEQNLAAVAAVLDAMRAIERHGGAVIIDRAFKGFTALPENTQTSADWRGVLGFKEGTIITAEDAKLNFRALSKKHHPDMQGGDAGTFAVLKRAYEMALQELK